MKSARVIARRGPAATVAAAEAPLACCDTQPLRFGRQRPFTASNPLLAGMVIYATFNQMLLFDTFS